MVGVNRPECVDVSHGAEYGLAALTFICQCFPLVVEAGVAESDCTFGVEVRVAVANGMETEHRVSDVGGVLVVLEHVGFDPYVPVRVRVGPGGAPVDPDA